MSIPEILNSTTLDEFPATHLALKQPDGLLAIGGDLSPPRLLKAYHHGIFPWYNDDNPILWWSPASRCVFLPQSIKISKSLHKILKSARYKITFDQAFHEVITGCAAPRASQTSTWITPNMITAYTELHQQGYAHSVEVWNKEGRLVGGLYGVSLGTVFFGESMFSVARDASKVALVYLTGQLSLWKFELIDCQFPTDHLLRLGASIMSRDQFMELIDQATHKPTLQGSWAITYQYAP